MSLATARVQFIIPKEATNLVTNPRFEIDTTGYTAFGAGVSVARVLTQSRRGPASCEITTATGVASGIYYAIALTSGVQYSFSADILDVLGQTFNLFIASATIGTLASANITWTGTGYWKRRSVTWTPTSSATFYLFVTRSSVASTTKFYTDGWQLETGAVSTYLDGNQIGFRGDKNAYRWNGTPYASTSWRSGQTRTGGTYLNLSTYAKLLTLIGLGMGALSNLSVPSTFGGAYYQNTISNTREFAIVANFTGGGDYSVIQTKRKTLLNAIKPDLVTRRQPLLIQYDQLDANSLEISETLMISAVYDGGLEGDGSGDSYNEKVAIRFTSYLPLIQQQGEHAAALGYQTAIADADYILMRSASGVWSKPVATAPGAAVYSIAPALDGGVFISGAFTDWGDANGDHIVKYNGTAVSSLGTGASSDVYTLAVGPDGVLYAGGNFVQMGGVAHTAYIAKWDGTTWAPLGEGTNFTVIKIVVGPDGYVYAGGYFSHVYDTGGAEVANAAYVAKWNPATGAWSAISTGTGGFVRSLAFDKAGNLYVGGEFTNLGDANGDYIVKWNGTSWSSLGTGANSNVLALNIGPDGTLYAGGDFTIMGGVAGTKYIAQWNGTTWKPLDTGRDGAIYEIVFDPNNMMHVSGNINKISVWTGSSWVPADVILPGAPYIYGMGTGRDKTFYIGYSTAGTAYSATVTVPNVGSTTTYPKILFTGPGTCWQIKNYTTGKSIFFDLTLLAGETATLNLDPYNLSFNSSFRGNILSTILPGSDLTWELLPGANNVSAFMYGSTSAATAIVMTWKDQYHSIDGAVR